MTDAAELVKLAERIMSREAQFDTRPDELAIYLLVSERDQIAAALRLAAQQDGADEALALIRLARPHVHVTAQSEKLLDGFKPRNDRESDKLLASIDEFLQRHEQ